MDKFKLLKWKMQANVKKKKKWKTNGPEEIKVCTSVGAQRLSLCSITLVWVINVMALNVFQISEQLN